ncbi:MAG TPA: TlpA disulfide reductase family protein [Chitinophaga sp.]
MKHQLLAVCCLGALAACTTPAAKKASITASLTGLKDSVVYISIPVGDSAKTDTVPVKDGHFTWQGTITEPENIYIATAQRYIELYMEHADVQIQGNMDSIEQIKITGSKTQEEYDAYRASLADITAQEDTLYGSYDAVKNNETAKAALEARLDSLRTLAHARTDAYIKAHPGSVLSVNLIADRAVMGEYAPLDSLYQLLTPAAKQLDAAKRLATRLAVLKKSAIGQPFLDFTQNDVNGKPVHLSDYKGKYVLLDFWASWCGPCRAENPNVLKTYNRFKDKNFTVVGVSLDESADKWKEAIAQDKMPWMQVSDLKGWRNEVAAQYGIQAIPCSFLIDPNGIILAKGLRGEALPAKLATLLD